MQTYPIAKDLVLVGGGHSHVIVLRMLAMRRVPGLRVTLVAPDHKAAYSGMLPGLVAGHYSSDEIHIDLGRLARFCGARLVRARATGIDPVAQVVRCDGRPDVSYDVVSIDTGITPELSAIEGAEAGIAVKPINSFLDKFDAFLDRVRGGNVTRVGFVGGGAGGVELCLAVAHRLRNEVPGGRTDVHLFVDKTSVLPDYDRGVQERFARHLSEAGVTLHAGFTASRFAPGTLASAEGEACALDEVFFVTRAAAPAWLRGSGLPLDENGFIKVRATLQSTGFDNVFAAGDVASVEEYPRPRAGVFAVRQGKPLYRNLVAFLHGREPRRFRPQTAFLSLISTGRRYAVASRNGRSVEGQWVWRWKDWIDRRFMRRFNNLPVMKREKFDGLLSGFDEQMHCGGCGAKVSADILSEVLGELDIDAGALDDAALVPVPPGKSVLSTVDGFRSFIDDPFVFAKVAANHALGDIYAMGGAPVSALALVTLPYATPGKTRDLLRQLMLGAEQLLHREGVALAGGHTSEGMELSLGFAVNGVVDPKRISGKSGLKEGDCLVLTKALGTGALFAADMQARARGEWIDRAIAGMLGSNRTTLQVLSHYHVHGATDVTGFGLAGHLSEMLRASHCRAMLDLDALPILPGALEVMGQGIFSTLHEGNRRSVPAVGYAGHRAFEILFDPQTAGGLLVSLPARDADNAVGALRAAGCGEAAVIGFVYASDTPSIDFGSLQGR